jgi:uncharacterized protein YfaP (DUF2135 family)
MIIQNLVFLLALSGDSPVPPSPAPPAIELPRGGWRDSSGARTGYLQRVTYPASAVNTENADPSATIQGHIAQKPKGLPTLVVNGTPLPLHVDESGDFARPWVFGGGSNGVELRVPGSKPVRTQFVEVASDRPVVKLRIVLTWDSDGTDLDLHVVGPTGQHTWYGNRVAPSGGALDIDVTTGYGPEIFSDPAPPPGLYHVYVNYYGSGERSPEELTVAQVTILSDEGTPKEKRQLFAVPMRRPGELTLVHSFVYP